MMHPLPYSFSFNHRTMGRSLLLVTALWFILACSTVRTPSAFHLPPVGMLPTMAATSCGSPHPCRTVHPSQHQSKRQSRWNHWNHHRAMSEKNQMSLFSVASSSSGMLLLDSTVAIASLSATIKLLCSIGLGVWASRKKIRNNKTGTSAPVLDSVAISSLSRLTYWIFQPAFLLSSVTKTFALAAASSSSTASGAAGTASFLSASQLAIMPLAAMFQIGMGASVGSILSPASKKQNKTEDSTDTTKNSNDPQGQSSKIVRMCTTYANSGPLPLIFADALFASKAPAIQSQVVACISFYLLAWSPLFWSFGRMMLGTTESTSNLIGQGPLGRLRRQIQQLLSPPVVGMLLGMVIGITTPIRNLFLSGWANPLFSAIQTIGTAYLPAALLVLAGSVASPKTSSSHQEGDEQGKSSANNLGPLGTIALARFILAPCWSLAFVWGLNQLNLLGGAGTPARAILSFVILMEGCMPPAQNSVVMLQLVGFTQAASAMAQTLTILYGLAVVPVTLLLSGCLSISGIGQFLN